MNRPDFRVITLFEFKPQRCAAEGARNIAFAFGLKSPPERTVRYWFENISFGDLNLLVPGRKMSKDDKVSSFFQVSVELKQLAAIRKIGRYGCPLCCSVFIGPQSETEVDAQ